MATNTVLLQDKQKVHLLSRMKEWTLWIRDQTAQNVQSDFDLHCPLKLVVSKVRKKIMYS